MLRASLSVFWIVIHVCKSAFLFTKYDTIIDSYSILTAATGGHLSFHIKYIYSLFFHCNFRLALYFSSNQLVGSREIRLQTRLYIYMSSSDSLHLTEIQDSTWPEETNATFSPRRHLLVPLRPLRAPSKKPHPCNLNLQSHLARGNIRVQTALRMIPSQTVLLLTSAPESSTPCLSGGVSDSQAPVLGYARRYET